MKKNMSKVMSTPFQIGNLSIKNRYVMCAMGGVWLYSVDGKPMDDTYEYYIRRAKGGVGLIITRALIVKPIGLRFKLFDRPDIFEPMRDFVSAVHQYGCKIFIQLSMGAGRTLHTHPEIMEKKGVSFEDAYFAPSKVPNVWYPEVIHRELSVGEIEEYIECFSKLAAIFRGIGFDGVEIHALHEGYLLDQFAMSCTNYRSDAFGGNIDKRFELPCRIVRSIKKSCGDDFPVIMRFSVESKMKGFSQGGLPGESYSEFGRTKEESAYGAQLLKNAGCDALDVDNGSYDAWYWAHPPVYMSNNCNVDECVYLKRHVDLPVILAGKMDTRSASEYVENGICDALGIARALLADPDYVNKALDEKWNEVRPCIGCHNGCLGRVETGKTLSCALNPLVLRENEEKKRNNRCIGKSVAVIGAGIAGIQASIELADYGFNVALYEKSGSVGGVFNQAASFSYKERDKELLTWFRREIRKHKNIRLFLNTEVDATNIDSDFIIIATGAKTKKTIIPGAYTAQEYLTNRPDGYNYVVVGGGLTGCEICLDLCRAGKKVSLVEYSDSLLSQSGLCSANRMYLLNSLNYYGVSIYIHSELVLEGELVKIVNRSNGISSIIPNDSVVISCIGSYAEPILANDNSFIIGDAVKTGNLLDAIHGAHSVVNKIIGRCSNESK